MLNRRAFLCGAMSLALAVPLVVEAQQAGKVSRIGFLCPTRCEGPLYRAFIERLAELGWRDGDNLQIDARGAGGQIDRLPALAKELVAGDPRVIVTAAPQAARAAQDATSTIPIVFTIVSDPVRIGLVQSLARPGHNATGLTTTVPDDFFFKMFELLNELLPTATRIAVVINPDNDIHRVLSHRQALQAAAKLKLDIRVLGVRSQTDVEPAIDTAVRENAEALMVPGDPVHHTPHFRDAVVRSNLPAMYLMGDIARAEGLIAYGPDFRDMFRRAAAYVDRILRGANPAELPVEQPAKFELVINLKTARALGLTIPPSLLLRADEVIE